MISICEFWRTHFYIIIGDSYLKLKFFPLPAEQVVYFIAIQKTAGHILYSRTYPAGYLMILLS